MERLKMLRKREKWTQQEVASKLGVDRSTYTKYETGQSEPNFETLQKIAALFGVSTDFILNADINEKPHAHKGVMIPVLGEVAAGVPIETLENILDYEEISKEMAAKGDHFGLRLRGESMAPRMCEGDVVIVRRQSDADTGSVAVVLVNGDSATVKNIRKEADGLWLIPNNPVAFEPKFYTCEECAQLPVQIIGVVVELRAKF